MNAPREKKKLSEVNKLKKLSKLNKRGMELSINTIVLLIISIAIFIGAFALVRMFFTQATQISAGLDKSVKDNIENILRQGNTVITIPYQRATVKRGQAASFGLGVRNILGSEHTFCTAVFFDEAYQQNHKRIGKEFGTADYDASYVQQNWVGSFEVLNEPGKLKNNDFVVVPLSVTAANSMSQSAVTLKGTYAFDVCVFVAPEKSCTKTTAQVCKQCKGNLAACAQQEQENPENNVYTAKLLKAYVEVIE